MTGFVVEVFEVWFWVFFFFGWLVILFNSLSPRAKDSDSSDETRPLVGFLHANNRGALE